MVEAGRIGNENDEFTFEAVPKSRSGNPEWTEIARSGFRYLNDSKPVSGKLEENRCELYLSIPDGQVVAHGSRCRKSGQVMKQ